ncbi:MFRP isoform 4 [Pan troglodytes]|uniref:MFRP isoform 4 n=1 Tax=Pan troglodytes TaxID=9598 RepID=A0A2J8N266_PANTR|nr:MFRP isoform 4 [Pan troglodytes]
MKDFSDVILCMEATESSKVGVLEGYGQTAASPGSVSSCSPACSSCCLGCWWPSSWPSCRLQPHLGRPIAHCLPEALPRPPPPPPSPPLRQLGPLKGSRSQA